MSEDKKNSLDQLDGVLNSFNFLPTVLIQLVLIYLTPILDEALALTFGLNRKKINEVTAISFLETKITKCRQDGIPLSEEKDMKILLSYLLWERCGRQRDAPNTCYALTLLKEINDFHSYFYQGRIDEQDNPQNESFQLAAKCLDNLSIESSKDPWTIYMIAYMYQDGLGVTKDTMKAVELYRQAADAGHSGAQHNLAALLDGGVGVTKDEKEASRLFAAAAEQGDSCALTNVGYSYFKGLKPQEAFETWMLAASVEDVEAQYYVGWCYQHGSGVQTDLKEAFKWFLGAAQKGNEAAQYCVGRCYERGHGTPIDKEKAILWYRAACRRGVKKATRRLELLGVA